MTDSDRTTDFCLRCRKSSSETDAMFDIQVVAKESPRAHDIPDLNKSDAEMAYQDLVQAARLFSSADAIDSVVRTTHFYLCSNCLTGWIENPV